MSPFTSSTLPKELPQLKSPHDSYYQGILRTIHNLLSYKSKKILIDKLDAHHLLIGDRQALEYYVKYLFPSERNHDFYLYFLLLICKTPLDACRFFKTSSFLKLDTKQVTTQDPVVLTQIRRYLDRLLLMRAVFRSLPLYLQELVYKDIETENATVPDSSIIEYDRQSLLQEFLLPNIHKSEEEASTMNSCSIQSTENEPTLKPNEAEKEDDDLEIIDGFQRVQNVSDTTSAGIQQDPHKVDKAFIGTINEPECTDDNMIPICSDDWVNHVQPQLSISRTPPDEVSDTDEEFFTANERFANEDEDERNEGTLPTEPQNNESLSKKQKSRRIRPENLQTRTSEEDESNTIPKPPKSFSFDVSKLLLTGQGAPSIKRKEKIILEDEVANRNFIKETKNSKLEGFSSQKLRTTSTRKNLKRTPIELSPPNDQLDETNAIINNTTPHMNRKKKVALSNDNKGRSTISNGNNILKDLQPRSLKMRHNLRFSSKKQSNLAQDPKKQLQKRPAKKEYSLFTKEKDDDEKKHARETRKKLKRNDKQTSRKEIEGNQIKASSNNQEFPIVPILKGPSTIRKKNINVQKGHLSSRINDKNTTANEIKRSARIKSKANSQPSRL